MTIHRGALRDALAHGLIEVLPTRTGFQIGYDEARLRDLVEAVASFYDIQVAQLAEQAAPRAEAD